jgi:hypothetical protein
MDCRAFISSDPSVASRGSIGGSVEMAMDCSRINKGKPFRIRKFKWVIFDSLRFSNVSDDTHHNLCIMVLVEEVPEDVQLRDDEHESDFETDSNVSEVSAFSDDDDFSPADETIYDRSPTDSRFHLGEISECDRLDMVGAAGSRDIGMVGQH